MNNNKKPPTIDYVNLLLERGRMIGIEQAIIYKAYKRGIKIELLSQVFDLSPIAILEIVEKMELDN